MLYCPPISVTGVSAQRVTKLSTGPALVAATDARTEFWEFLHGWGGTWMWEVIEPGKDTPADVSWIVEGLQEGSLIWTTAGLYDQKRAVDLCGVGWIIFYTKTGFRLTGTFWEHSPSASSYRAELLGLCALHILTQALAEFYTVTGWTAMLCCDNKRALEVSAQSASHPTECKMRRHTPQSQGGQTAPEGTVLICACLRTHGPYARVGATLVAPAAQLRVQHTSETLGHRRN